MENLALVYMVAGMSSRFGKVKQFAKVGPNNETLIEYSLNQALKAGFSKIIFIVGEKTEHGFKEMFKDSYKGIPVYYALQSFDKEKRDKPLGTVDALCSALPFLDCNFIICNGDDIYGENSFKLLAENIKNKKSCATLGYKLKKVLSETGDVNRGIFEIENEKVKSIKEVFNINLKNLNEKNLKEESLASMNIFALTPEIVPELKNILEDFKEKNKEDRKAECLLPQELGNLIKAKKIDMEIFPTEENWLGLTNPEDEEKVRNQIKILEKIKKV